MTTGRPAIGPQITLRLPQPLIDTVQTYATTHRTTRADAFRSLIEDGLTLRGDERRLTSGWNTGSQIDDQDDLDRYTDAILADNATTLTSASWSNGASLDLVRYTCPDTDTVRYLIWETSDDEQGLEEWVDYADEGVARAEWAGRAEAAEQWAANEGATRVS